MMNLLEINQRIKQRPPFQMIERAVSYTHLDVYKRQESDICLVIANLLENAFEASMKLDRDKRQIKMYARRCV